MVKGIFLVLDGVADEKTSALDYKTPLQVASTPNLDRLAKKSKLDYCYPVREGVVPDSASAIISLLGRDPNEAFRGPLEAKGAGVKIARGDLVLRTNFATVDGLDGEVLDGRAGRTLSTKESWALAKAINTNVKLPFKFEFYPTVHHRGVLVFRGGFSDNISDADPYYRNGFKSGSARVVFSHPLDDEDDSKLAANLVNNFIRKSHEVLDKHYLNESRAKKGLFSANFILCRGAGCEIPKYQKLKGKWMAFSSMPLEKGIAEAMKMDLYRMKYPKFKGMDVYSNLYAGLLLSMKASMKMIKRFRKRYDYFFIHIKETDTPGHDNKPLDKIKMIELIDRKLIAYLEDYCKRYGVKLMVASDHVTSCKRKGHVEGFVPVMLYDPLNEEDKDKRFTEEDALKGKKLVSKKLLERALFGK